MKLPKCDYCNHLHEEMKDRMCCDAFPEGIPPEKITWGDEEIECANGIKFEDGESAGFISKPDGLLSRMHRV